MNEDFNQYRGLESYKKPRIPHNGIYSTALIIGISVVIYVYVFSFDNFSETELIFITPFWVFPLVFGYFGFIAQWLQGKLTNTEHENVAQLMFATSRKLPSIIIRPIFNIIHMPLFVVNNNKPMVSAIIGSALWVIFLMVFFVVIFPAL